jgi:hypothetical protein
MLDTKHYTKTMAYMAQALCYDPGKKQREEHFKVLYTSLMHLNQKAFDWAVEKVMSTFVPSYANPFPAPAHFLSVLEDAKADLIIPYIRKAIDRHGAHDTVDFGDLKLHAVIDRFGGWQKVARWSDEDWKWHEKRFLSAYKAALPDGPAFLIGIDDENNSFHGFENHIQEPKQIKLPWEQQFTDGERLIADLREKKESQLQIADNSNTQTKEDAQCKKNDPWSKAVQKIVQNIEQRESS